MVFIHSQFIKRSAHRIALSDLFSNRAKGRQSKMIDSRLVLLSKEDNVFVCCNKLVAGTLVSLGSADAVMAVDINVGHKISRRAIKQGEKITKYAVSIGSATQDIAFGEHIHLHNMKSDYISSHTRESRVGEIK